ncbi:MAG: DUF637 domain-containing protein [Rhodocyclaceae bacterium]
MTATGVIKGSDRQQVSLIHTSDKKGTTSNGPTSKVLGNLAAQGIRSGAADSFAPEALQTGQAAVAALMQNGLLTIRNQPAIQATLNAPVPNGSALTYKDSSGRVTLTVAGEAKVQAVYNQLKLTETFDVKHFADQGTAQVVTLVAAIALTVMTSGAGAAMVGATGAASSAAANAAFIAMASTMTGQLAAGASFDQAFQVALKAGTTSAITAGILNTQMIDTAQGMQSINQLANVQTTGANIVGNFNADTLGQNLMGIGARGVVNAGVSTAINGGSFGDAFRSSVVGDLAAVGANAVGQGPQTLSPGNILGHAAVGCVAAAANGKGCASGAIGGAGAAVVNPLLDQAIGGSDGSGWGSNPETAQQMQTATLQLGSMAISAATAAALGKDGMTAALAAQNETVNNYLTRNQIEDKAKALANAKTEADRQKVLNDYAALDGKQRDAAAACLLGGNCASVTDPAAIKAALADLNAACAPPRICKPEAKASIAELNALYGKAESIAKVYPVETLIALLATGGLSVSAGGATGVSTGMRVTGGIIGVGANYSFQDKNLSTDSVDLAIAGVTGYLAMGRTLWPTTAINTSGALIGSTIKGEDPYPGMAGAALGTIVGYRAGKSIEVPLDNRMNHWSRIGYFKGNLEISKWYPPSMVPSLSGNLVSSIAQENTGNNAKNAIVSSGK